MPKSYPTKQADPKTPAATPIAKLVDLLEEAKSVEHDAKENRIMLEEQIAKLLGGPDDGGKTFTLDDKSKVTITRGFLFSAECEDIKKLYILNGFDSPAPVGWKKELKLDTKAYKELATKYPSIYKQVAQYVTVKPKKTSVTIKRPEA
jgi:uncharacterized ubiquitin-like protein YukD